MLEGARLATILALSAALLYLLFMLRGYRAALAQVRNELEETRAIPGEKAAQWQATLRGIPDGLMLLDRDFRLVEWNQHFPEFAGIPAESLRAGMHISDILRVQAKAGEFGDVDVEQEVQRRFELIKDGTSTGTIERRRPNGRIMELRRSPLSEGGVVTLYTDITERRQAEDQLRQAQKMEAIGHLTGGIAHDFNNLLTVVIGNIDLAHNALQASNPTRALAKLDDARAGAERGAILTQRLLAFSRRQSPVPQPCDVNKIVATLSGLIRSSIGPINLETILPDGLWHTAIDPNQLENALLNLAINARDAMPEGGKITIETANANLDAAYAAALGDVSPGRYVMVAVSDHGTGMSPEAMERAFEPLFTTKEVGKGSGLGLSQVFDFIKQSKGHVKIDSKVGQGTTVKLYLPYTAHATMDTDSTLAGTPRAAAEENILAADDHPRAQGFDQGAG
ncbi:MAG TPA: hypothetical protein DDZ81_07050 [Acetobacteraceae bacterium]|jgi:PAS domain S-box-containing protein|nr:hypothetical protein [Acetobacteraceae bacterium]